jgi:hypothetical protein
MTRIASRRLRPPSKTGLFEAVRGWDAPAVEAMLAAAPALVSASDPRGRMGLHLAGLQPILPRASFSALLNRVTAGKHAGLVTLRDEEVLAWRLVGDLAPSLQARARASDAALGNILSCTGRERSNTRNVGLPATELGSADPAAQHLHTIYHDLGNVLGRAA